MSRTMPFDSAGAQLMELVSGMVPGEEIVLTSEGNVVAVVTRPTRTSWPSEPGTAKDTRHWMAPDFDAPLEEFME